MHVVLNLMIKLLNVSHKLINVYMCMLIIYANLITCFVSSFYNFTVHSFGSIELH